MFSFSFEAFGTVLEIQVFDKVPKILQEKIKTEIFDYTIFFDDNFSRFKSDSLITKISNNPGIYSVPQELTEMLRHYEKFYNATNGAMNPLVGNTLSDLGYDAKYTLRPKEKISETPKLNEVVKIVSDTQIEVKEKVLIDVGALGKGFWVDKVCEILKRNSITHFLVNGSGDIYYSNPRPGRGINPSSGTGVKINLESPFESGKIIGTTTIFNEAICGSGTGRRNWSTSEKENLHHIVNANTGKPTEEISAVWIKAKTTTIADGLATAIFFVEPDTLKSFFEKQFDFEYLIIYKNKKILFSKNFDIKF